MEFDELPRASNYPLLSEIATNDGHGENSSYFDGWKAYDSDPFHPTKNPNGVVQMGLAENQLCLDLMQDWIKENPKASICTEAGVSEFKVVANFQDYHGLPEFRMALAKFMGKVRGGRVNFDPERIVMSGGATGANEILAFCLADPGEAFLVPTPYYPAFDRDLRWRTGIQLLPIHCESSNHFKITRTALECAYKKAEQANIRVKGVLLSNPSNPLGTTLDKEILRTLVSFVNAKRIHLICDEIFAGTDFREPRFVGVSEILEENPNWDRSLIHVTYSLSKVLGLPGFRVGVVYSYNDSVVCCARRMSSFGLVSSQTQYLLASMLSDDEFTTKLITESRRRLSKRHEMFTSQLAQVGIQCLESNAGLFCWMDLRWLLKEFTVEGELELWHVILNDIKLNISPGSSFHCSEPGWFRVCIANMDDETMKVALQRIKSHVHSVEEAAGQAKKEVAASSASVKLTSEVSGNDHHDPNPNVTTLSSCSRQHSSFGAKDKGSGGYSSCAIHMRKLVAQEEKEEKYMIIIYIRINFLIIETGTWVLKCSTLFKYPPGFFSFFLFLFLFYFLF